MAAIVALAVFLLPGYAALTLHVRLDSYRTAAGHAARRNVGKWIAWREQLRPANYRPEGRRLLRWYTITLIVLQLGALAAVVILAYAYP